MSTRQASSISKICATCEYYGGSRCTNGGSWVNYQSGNGICSRPPINLPIKTYADSRCSYWKKWGALR